MRRTKRSFSASLSAVRRWVASEKAAQEPESALTVRRSGSPALDGLGAASDPAGLGSPSPHRPAASIPSGQIRRDERDWASTPGKSQSSPADVLPSYQSHLQGGARATAGLLRRDGSPPAPAASTQAPDVAAGLSSQTRPWAAKATGAMVRDDGANAFQLTAGSLLCRLGREVKSQVDS